MQLRHAPLHWVAPSLHSFTRSCTASHAMAQPGSLSCCAPGHVRPGRQAHHQAGTGRLRPGQGPVLAPNDARPAARPPSWPTPRKSTHATGCCFGVLDFLWRKSRRKSTRGCGPWTPGVRGGGFLPSRSPSLVCTDLKGGVSTALDWPAAHTAPGSRWVPSSGRQASVEGTLRAATVDGKPAPVIETNGRKICSKNIKDSISLYFFKASI